MADSEHPESDVTVEMPNPSVDEVVTPDDVTVEVTSEKLKNEHPDVVINEGIRLHTSSNITEIRSKFVCF